MTQRGGDKMSPSLKKSKTGLAVSRVLPIKIVCTDGTEIRLPRMVFAPVNKDGTISQRVWYQNEEDARNA